MGTADLHGVVKSHCFNTDWKYVVFWKLKHRARMVLTWEDCYYDNCEQNDTLQNKYSRETLENLHYTHDRLAVAKMSYHVYSLGEGSVREVAVTGKYRWIFADQHVTNSCSSFGLCDGWQSQFSAGIRTVVVVAVIPHGVVQLGSSKKDVLNIIKFHPLIMDIGLKMRFLDTAYFGGLCEPGKDLNVVCAMHVNCCYGLDSKFHDLRIMLADRKRYLSLPPTLKRSSRLSWSIPHNCSLDLFHPRGSRRKSTPEV